MADGLGKSAQKQLPPIDLNRKLGGIWQILGFLLLVLLVAAAVVLFILNIKTIYQPHLLFPVLITIFSTGGGLVIAFFAVRTYIVTSNRRVLFLGGGALAWGIASLIAGWLPASRLNLAVTVSNFGVLLAAMLHFLGAIQKPKGDVPSNPINISSNRRTPILFCSGVLAFFILISLATNAGLFPVFYVPGAGYTLIRYIFSAIYSIILVFSVVVYARLYMLFPSKFIYWYTLGLTFIVFGLIAGFLGTAGNPLNWVGRIGQFTGSLYFIVAVVITQNEARNEQIGVTELVARYLSQAKANYELLFNSAADAITALDGTGRILTWNPAAEKMFGYRQSEVIGMPFFNLISSPEQAEAYQKAAGALDSESISSAHSVAIDLKARRRNGEEFPVELTLVSKKLGAGSLPTTTLVVRDITERKRAEEELKRYTAELEVSNKELEAFAYSVSHDLRAPLRTLDGFSQAVIEDYGDKLDETGKDYLRRVRDATKHMDQITKDMLTLSRVIRSELRMDDVNLSDIVSTIAKELREKAPGRKVEFIISPDMTAKGDASLLQMALFNLIENSWKFTAKIKEARIEFGTIFKDNEQIYFITAVQDNWIM